MTGMHLNYSFHVQGSPVGDEAEFLFNLPVDAKLVHVSAVGSNAHDSLLDIGVDGVDGDGVVRGFEIGASGTPSVCMSGGFNGALVTDTFYHFKKSQIVRIYIDGAAGSTAIDDPTIVLSFVEG